jgi:hypothetical protein
MSTRRTTICGWLILVFAGLYLVALALFAIGYFGLFGSEPSPLAGVFLVPLGIPWIYLLDSLPVPQAALLWAGLLAPLINLVLLWSFCRLVRSGTR